MRSDPFLTEPDLYRFRESFISVAEAEQALSDLHKTTDNLIKANKHETLVLLLLHKLLRRIFKTLGSRIRVSDNGDIYIETFMNIRSTAGELLSTTEILYRSYRYSRTKDHYLIIHLQVPYGKQQENFKDRMRVYSPFDFSEKYHGTVLYAKVDLKPNINKDDLVIHLRNNGLLAIVDLNNAFNDNHIDNVLYVRDADNDILRRITKKDYPQDIHMNLISKDPMIQDYVCRSINSMSEIYFITQQLKINAIRRNLKK